MKKYFFLFAPLILFSLLLSYIFFSPKQVQAANQVVTNNNNSGAGSLRQAILDIEASDSDGDAITFNLSSGNETITISSQFALIWQKNFSIDGDNTAGSGTNVTIQVTTPGTSTFRIFEIRPYSGTYTFSNMTLYGGDVSGSEYGGTIKVYSGDSTGNLTLNNITINGSKAKYGGCVYAWGTMGTLTITSSTFTNCQATNASPYGGGALFMRSVGTISISSSSFTNNTSNYNGGGIYMYDQTFTMDKITVSGNTATNQGGGVYLDGDNALSAATLSNSTISGNISSSHGGGLLLYYGNTRIVNSTISGNTATGVGGGFYSGYGSPYLVNTTIANNTSSGGTAEGIYHEGGSTLYMKNTIIANNSTGYDVTNNATISDGGYNIVESSSGKTFNATGDLAGSQSSLNLSSSLGNNNTLNGTQTLALSSGSVAINAGNDTTYQSITISSTDQRGYDRVSTLDIGAYEYGVGENTNPSTPSSLGGASLVDGSTGSSNQPSLLFTLADTDSSDTVKYQIQIDDSSDFSSAVVDYTSALAAQGSASFTVGQTAGSGSYTTGSASQTLSNGSYYWRVKAIDNSAAESSYATANSGSVAFIVDATAPTVSSVSVTPSSTTAAVTWTTSETASSIVDYGLTDSLGSSTAEADTSPRVTSHSVTVSSLVACSTYYYRVRSKDAATNSGTSSTSTFTTTGCTGSATVSAESISSQLATGSGGTATLTNNSETATLTVPAGYSGSAAYFQIKQIDKASVISTTSSPTGYTAAGNMVYDFKALSAVDTSITSFSQPITVSLVYTDSDVTGLDESTFWIYRWDGSAWQALSGCSVTAASNTIICTTTSFSTFTLFGQASSSNNSSSGTSSSSSDAASSGPPVCADLAPVEIPNLFQIDTGETSALLYFKTVKGVTGYQISYGLDSKAQSYGDPFAYTGPFWIYNRQINNLSPDTTYYFKIRAVNGCNAGPYSQVLSAKIGSAVQTSVLISEIKKEVNSQGGGVIEKAVEESAKIVSEIPVAEKLVERKIEISKTELKPKTSLFTYVVKEGENLWGIATNIFGEGRRYADLMAQNSGDLMKNLKPGDLLKIDQKHLSSEQIAESFPEQSPQKEGYDLDIKVMARRGEPLKGVKVTLHSTPRESQTNDNGVAHFDNVEPGEHKVYLAYKGYDGGGQAINVTGESKDLELVMQIDLKEGFSSPKVLTVIAFLVGIIVSLVVIIIKSKKRRRN